MTPLPGGLGHPLPSHGSQVTFLTPRISSKWKVSGGIVTSVPALHPNLPTPPCCRWNCSGLKEKRPQLPTPAAEAKPETKASATASPRARPGTFPPSLQLRKGRSDSALSARCRRSKTVAGCPGQIAGNLTLTGRNM